MSSIYDTYAASIKPRSKKKTPARLAVMASGFGLERLGKLHVDDATAAAVPAAVNKRVTPLLLHGCLPPYPGEQENFGCFPCAWPGDRPLPTLA